MSFDNDLMQIDDVTAHLSQLAVHEHPFPLLHLPPSTIERIIDVLPSDSCRSLAATCRAFRQLSPLGYSHITFQPHWRISSLVAAFEKLAATLKFIPAYAAAVRSISVEGLPRLLDGVEISQHKTDIPAFDRCLAHVLELASGLTDLTIDLWSTDIHHTLPAVLMQILSMPFLSSLVLNHILVPSYTEATSTLLPSTGTRTSTALRRGFLGVSSGSWLSLLFYDTPNLRWLELNILEEASVPDRSWLHTLAHVAKTAINLHTLILAGHRNFDVSVIGDIFHQAFRDGSLANLRGLGINTPLDYGSVQRLFSGFHRSSVTHVRLIVNYGGQWVWDFSPAYIHTLSSLVPNLEELTLERLGTTDVCTLPGDLDEWARAFRAIPRLRRLALASTFVIDVYGPVDDYALDATESDSDFDSDVDLVSVSDSESGESSESEPESPPSTRFTAYQYNLTILAAWAEEFLDEHLRHPGLQEIWFHGIRKPFDKFASARSVGFRQILASGSGPDPETARYIINPATSDGWWWQRFRTIASDD